MNDQVEPTKTENTTKTETNGDNAKLSHEVLFRVDDEMFGKLPTGRNRSAFCRKAVELLLIILELPNQKQVLDAMGYDSFSIFERVIIAPRKESITKSDPKEIEEMNKTIADFKAVLLTFGDLFGLFNKTLKTDNQITKESFMKLAPPQEKMQKLMEVMKKVRGGQ